MPSLLPLLPACNPKQLGALLRQAVFKNDQVALGEVVEHIKHSVPEAERNHANTNEALGELARMGQWERAVNVLALLPADRRAWGTRDFWAQATKNDDMRFLEFLEPLEMAGDDIPLHLIFEHERKAMFIHVCVHYPEQLPTLKGRNQTCAGPLRMTAGMGEKACQDYLEMLRDIRMPKELVEDRIQRISGIAWGEIFRTHDKMAAQTLASLALWGKTGPDLLALFDHSDLGVGICRDEKARLFLGQRLLATDKEGLDGIGLTGMNRMLEAGLPLLQWKDPDGWHAGHLALAATVNHEDAIAWLMMEAPLLIATPGSDGSLPTDMIKGKQKDQYRQLGAILSSHYQASQLDAAAPGISKGARAPRL